ncbi:hypothetical protein [Flavobacterium sp. 245]|uniref:hypothetical protein n=1 Tax=Flavobacterium sp. 245 TaxID=2512115 RepID=UPI00105C46EF|nr:hypothetical protein [Flavobacterium sp. 245]TDP00352.1 hypothetical protein EV145_106248 [Flavobacterium sp. 245]
MIKTKTSFLTFAILCLIVFPYHIAVFFINSDALFSIIPGWHTTIVPGQIVSNLIKFLILLIVTICYWKLSQIQYEINFKKFLIHLLLTIPAIFVGRFSLYELISPDSIKPKDFINCIQIIVLLNIFISILFFLGQTLFLRFYYQSKKFA